MAATLFSTHSLNCLHLQHSQTFWHDNNAARSICVLGQRPLFSDSDCWVIGQTMSSLTKGCRFAPPNSLITLWNGCTRPFNYNILNEEDTVIPPLCWWGNKRSSLGRRIQKQVWVISEPARVPPGGPGQEDPSTSATSHTPSIPVWQITLGRAFTSGSCPTFNAV